MIIKVLKTTSKGGIGTAILVSLAASLPLVLALSASLAREKASAPAYERRWDIAPASSESRPIESNSLLSYHLYLPLVLNDYVPLKAAFTYTPTIIYPNTVVHFSDRSTDYPTAWWWDFGDGHFSPLQNPTHTYALTGTYTVCLTVTNLSEIDSATDVITVEAAPPTEGDTTYEMHIGWVIEAYPEMSKEEMRAIVRRQREHGADVVWMGHNNPGEVDRNKAEPGLSYAVYRAYIDPVNPLHGDAQAIVSAQYRMLDVCREEGMKVILPIGYQIQMGAQWNAAHPNDLRRDYNGNPLDIGGISASFYSPAYRSDIQSYYEWVNANFIQPYKDVILMINLADEPQGGDYSSHANAVFTDRYGFSFWQVGADPQRWRELGQFQAHYIAEYAAWSANLWRQIDPEVQTTMSFCGLLARYGYLMPDIEPLFRDTPPNFAVTFDAYPRDGPPTEPITDHDLTSLFILIRALGHYSQIYDKPFWLWSTANSWGLGQASSDKADIADAVANLYYLVGLVTQTAGKLGGIVFWNYNLKGQGLYNDMNPIVYDPDEMFERVSTVGVNIRATTAATPSPIAVLLFAPSSYPYELIGKTKSWLQVTRLSRDLPTLRSLISSSALNYKYWDLNALARNNVNSIISPDLKSEDLQGVETILVLAPSLDYVSANELNTLYNFYLQGGKVVAKTQIAEALKARMANPQLTAITPYLTKITSSASDGSIYSTAQDVETIFSDAYQGALASLWKEVLGIEKLNGGYFVRGERDALLYTIAPAYFDVNIPFPYEGARYDRSGKQMGSLSGFGTLTLALDKHEYAWLYRSR